MGGSARVWGATSQLRSGRDPDPGSGSGQGTFFDPVNVYLELFAGFILALTTKVGVLYFAGHFVGAIKFHGWPCVISMYLV